MALALVRDLREHRAPAGAEELADFEADVLAGFVPARVSAGLPPPRRPTRESSNPLPAAAS